MRRCQPLRLPVCRRATPTSDVATDESRKRELVLADHVRATVSGNRPGEEGSEQLAVPETGTHIAFDDGEKPTIPARATATQPAKRTEETKRKC